MAQRSPRQPLRVLVVDDNADSVEMLSMLIEVSGHAAATALSGAEALSTATTFRPDVVFLDIGLPIMDGYDVARALRAQPGGPEMVLVALTGWSGDEHAERARQAGFDRQLTKPASPEAIEELLRGVVSSRL